MVMVRGQLMIMDEAARLDMAAEAEDARLVGDPSIAVGDLEKGLESYFSVVGYKNIQEILDCIKQSNVTWNSAPKARAWDLV